MMNFVDTAASHSPGTVFADLQFQKAWQFMKDVVDGHIKGEVKASSHLQMDGRLMCLTVHTNEPIEQMVAKMEGEGR